MEDPLIIRPDNLDLSESKMILLGDTIFVRATSSGIQFQPNLASLSDTSRTFVSLDYHEFRQLLEFSKVLKSALRKRPEHEKL